MFDYIFLNVVYYVTLHLLTFAEYLAFVCCYYDLFMSKVNFCMYYAKEMILKMLDTMNHCNISVLVFIVFMTNIALTT